MFYPEAALYVRIQSQPYGWFPNTWLTAFAADMAYRVLGYFEREINGLPDVLLCSDAGQQCFVPMRYLRAVAYVPGQRAYRLPLHTLHADGSLSLEHIAQKTHHAHLMQLQALCLASV